VNSSPRREAVGLGAGAAPAIGAGSGLRGISGAGLSDTSTRRADAGGTAAMLRNSPDSLPAGINCQRIVSGYTSLSGSVPL
jgi:hypothetical protein